MAEVIIPKPGTIYNEYICQGSDDNYYVKRNNQWVKVGGSSENINPLDPRVTTAIPAATKGDKFYVVADGIIGEDKDTIKLEKGDMLVCIKTTPGGIAADYDVLQKSFELSDYLKANDTENYNPFYAYKIFERLQIINTVDENTPPVDPIGLIIVKSITDPFSSIIVFNSLFSFNPQHSGFAKLRIINQDLTNSIELRKNVADVFCDMFFNPIDIVAIGPGSYSDFYTFFYNGIGYLMQM